HPMYVTETNTQSVDTAVVDADEATLSSKFNIAGGSFQFRKQATGSSDSYTDGFTILSATVENVQANVDSTLVIVFEDNFTRIAGLKSVPSEDLNGDDQISIRYIESGGFPGPHTVYLIPESRLSSKEYNPGDELPKSASDAALATKTAESVFSLIRFDDVNSTSVINDQITVSTAALYDEQGGKTPFVLTVHPLQSDGKIIRDQYLGVSDVLSGRNDDVEIQLKRLNGAKVSLAQSNRYGVMMRLVDEGFQVGDSVSPDSLTILQNSDLNRQFVENGVSDTALISIIKSDAEKAAATDSFSATTNYDDEVLYGGGTISFEHSAEDPEEITIHQDVGESTSVLKGVEATTEDSSLVYFNTTDFRTGDYFLTGAGFSENVSFKIIGTGDQYSNLTSVPDSASVGEVVRFKLSADTNTTELNIAGPNGTVAAVTLTTPRAEATTLRFNTYAAGDPAYVDDLVSLEGPGTIESVTTSAIDEPLPAGEYTITATQHQAGRPIPRRRPSPSGRPTPSPCTRP
ncbi:MAG: hypothetical protein A07HR67_00375, partial [uncultured archaeon A07HR67]